MRSLFRGIVSLAVGWIIAAGGAGADTPKLTPVTFVMVGQQGAVNSSFISGKVDAIVSYDENIPIFNGAGKPSKGFCERFNGLNYQQIDVATTRSYINAHRDIVAAFATALSDSVALASAHPADAAGTVYRANPAQKPLEGEVPAQQMHYVLSYYKTPNDSGHHFGWMSPKDWADTQSVAEKFFGLEPGFNFSSGWTDDFVR